MHLQISGLSLVTLKFREGLFREYIFKSDQMPTTNTKYKNNKNCLNIVTLQNCILKKDLVYRDSDPLSIPSWDPIKAVGSKWVYVINNFMIILSW